MSLAAMQSIISGDALNKSKMYFSDFIKINIFVEDFTSALTSMSTFQIINGEYKIEWLKKRKVLYHIYLGFDPKPSCCNFDQIFSQ